MILDNIITFYLYNCMFFFYYFTLLGYYFILGHQKAIVEQSWIPSCNKTYIGKLYQHKRAGNTVNADNNFHVMLTYWNHNYEAL